MKSQPTLRLYKKWFTTLLFPIILWLPFMSYGQDAAMSFTSQFRVDELNKLMIHIDDTDWRNSLNSKDVYTQAEISINDREPLVVEIARKGNSSDFNTRDRDKIPMKVRGPGGFNFKLNNNYRDGTNGAREYLGYRLHRAFNGLGSQVAVAEVFVNDSFYGVYNIVEDLNRRFFEEHLGGIIYRIKSSASTTGVQNQRLTSDLKWYGKNPEHYRGRYQFKEGQVNDLSALIQVINNEPKQTHHFLDIDQICRFLAVENYIANRDGIIGYLFSHNYEIVKRQRDSLWQLVPWDLNLTFGVLSYPDKDGKYPELEDLATMNLSAGVDKNALIQLILDEYYFLYLHYYRKLLKEFPDTVLIEWCRNFERILQQSEHPDEKLYPLELSSTSFTQSHTSQDGFIPGLIPFIEHRYRYLQSLQLDENYSNRISHVDIVGRTLYIKLEGESKWNPVLIEYETTEGAIERIRAGARHNKPDEFMVTLPENTVSFYIFTMVNRVKHTYPTQGKLAPLRFGSPVKG